jgi:hypothetical protein
LLGSDLVDKLADGLLWYMAFLFSTTLHEASHAFAAFRLGDRTAYEGGQLTLDPIPHILREPFGTVVVPIISFLLGGWMIGWASVPYDPQWAYDNPRSSAKMSAAGPAANLLLALLAALAIRLGIMGGLFSPPDGCGIIPMFLREDLARKYLGLVRNPSFSFIGIIVAWNIFDYIYKPLHLTFINLLFFGEAHYE